MAKQDKASKSGFVIKLSCETVQKLSEEDKPARSRSEDVSVSVSERQLSQKIVKKNATGPSSSEEQPSYLKKDVALNPPEHKDDSGNAATDINTADSTSAAWGEYAPYITYKDEEAIYTDPSTQQKYTWNKESNSWDPKLCTNDVHGRVYSYEDDTHIYTDADGSKCFWDAEKKAWLPKIDDDFLAYYQMSYGFVDNTSKEENKSDEPKKEDQKSASQPTVAKRKTEPQWFQPSEEKNTKVYVSNLPLDITEQEFVDVMQKCGLVERDPSTQKMKVKLYMDKEQNCFKGDALCTYIKIESVDLALKLIDGSDCRGNKLKVERAHFQLKGDYNPALKPKKKKKKELEKIKKMQQKLFDWRPEKFIGERSKHERVVIVKNLFLPSDFDQEVQLILDYQQDLREECSKSGEVRKVVVYDRHPEGVAQITMKEPEQADAVVNLINGRWFGKRQITAEIWDGRTKYRIAETDADLNKRVDKWGKFLEGKEEPKDNETVSKNSSSSEDIADNNSNMNLKSDEKVNTEVSSETMEFEQPA